MKDEPKGAFAHGSLPGLKELFAGGQVPNMDEVVRQVKAALEVIQGRPGSGITFTEAEARLLIEEREQDKAKYEELGDAHVRLYDELMVCEAKVVEQDKEIQRLENHIENIERKGYV